MAGAGAPWQFEFEKVEQRCGYLLTSGQWSDCTFMVGSEITQEVVIQAHKLVLAMASPVFEAMFYGGLSERNDPIVTVSDVQPEAFRALLQYIYTGNIDISSVDLALDLWYGAKKYLLPHLEIQCNTFICSDMGPKNACRAFEYARLFEDNAVMDKSIQIISTNIKEVLSDSSFVDVELNTLITVCSLDHLNVDSELDLFHAVARYAEADQRRQGQIDLPVEGGPLEEPGIRAALQKLRFLSLTAKEFAEGPARSGLLTEAETFAVLMNIASEDSAVPMPPGFSECRERRQPRSDSYSDLQKSEQCFVPGSLEHTIHALKCGDPSQVELAVEAAADILLGSPLDIQPALDKGILDALVPALTEGSDKCKEHAAYAIRSLCDRASPEQRRVLVVSAALEPYCRLLAAAEGYTSYYVMHGLTDLLERVERNVRTDLLRKLRALGVPELLVTVWEGRDSAYRVLADGLRTYFSDQ